MFLLVVYLGRDVSPVIGSEVGWPACPLPRTKQRHSCLGLLDLRGRPHILNFEEIKGIPSIQNIVKSRHLYCSKVLIRDSIPQNGANLQDSSHPASTGCKPSHPSQVIVHPHILTPRPGRKPISKLQRSRISHPRCGLPGLPHRPTPRIPPDIMGARPPRLPLLHARIRFLPPQIPGPSTRTKHQHHPRHHLRGPPFFRTRQSTRRH